MIEVSGLTKRFGEITALSDITFNVQKGQIVGFLGANGAGKTTTMDILCGCIGADNGKASICGYDVTDNAEDAKMHLGYLPDEPPLHNDMRVEEFITYCAKLHKVAGDRLRNRVNEVMETLALTDVRQRLVGNLSKGYRQRVGLAQAIVHEPAVLVLDEPTEGLDPTQIIHIRDLIKSLAGKHTILLSSHILSEVQNTCDHIVIVHKGRVVQQGTYDDLVRKVGSEGHYKLRVERNADRLVGDLGRVGGVSEVRLLDPRSGRIEFLYKDASVGGKGLDQVARTVIDGDYGLRELASNTPLEEIFIQLTH